MQGQSPKICCSGAEGSRLSRIPDCNKFLANQKNSKLCLWVPWSYFSRKLMDQKTGWFQTPVLNNVMTHIHWWQVICHHLRQITIIWLLQLTQIMVHSTHQHTVPPGGHTENIWGKRQGSKLSMVPINPILQTTTDLSSFCLCYSWLCHTPRPKLTDFCLFGGGDITLNCRGQRMVVW